MRRGACYRQTNHKVRSSFVLHRIGLTGTRYVDFVMSRVRMLKFFEVTPYLIFDGDYLPSKSKTEKERSARRKESRKAGLELLSMGKTSQAYLELQKAVDVTPEMAGLLIEELKRNGVQYVVAPYEADSQMVYLEKQGIIDGILSEDSDLLVFGAKKLLTKLDQYGECVMIRRDDFTACREVSLVGWSDKEFRQMAIMSGCDYLNSIDKMGLKTAYRMLRQHRSLERVVTQLRFDGKYKVPAGYLDAFIQAELTFLHQWVYCPKVKGLVHLTSLPENKTAQDLPFIGKYVEPKLATGVAKGHLHPHTKQPLQLPDVPAKRWMGPPQHRKPVVAETPELKKHKSIDSFFKPSRTPLAELDVNLFTGSPSQQEMARRASGSSWPATPVDNSTPGTAIRRPSAAPASAPLIARRAFSDNAALRRTSSDRANKRQRLCADGSSPVSQKNASRVEYGTSKFFGTPAAPATPSKRSKSARTAGKDFTLWSDDSVDEALSQLPMPEGFSVSTKRAKKKLEVFEDDKVESISADAEAGTPVAETETQVSTFSAVFSQDVQDAQDAPESPPSDVEAEIESQFDVSLRAEMSSLRSRFAFGAVSSTRKLISASPVKPAARRISTQADLPQLDGGGDDEKCDDEVDNADEDEVVIPGSDAIEGPSPSTSPSKTTMSLDTGQSSAHQADQVGGSEDLLVSESEAEVSEPGTPRARTFALDLGRFAFGAV